MHMQPAVNTLRKALRTAHSFMPRKRRTHVYCVGTAKSGTHSIAALFERGLRSNHEAEAARFIYAIIARSRGGIPGADFRRELVKRDRRLRLEIDSSQLNFFALKDLIELFPYSKFILTIRDPYTWLDSLINHQLARPVSEAWARMRDFRFRPDLHRHPAEEQVLEQHDLYTLDGYLSYWAYHNATVLQTVPWHRLLVVRTDELSANVDRIVTFVGAPGNRVSHERSHAFKAAGKFDILKQLDRAYLDAKVREHCGKLMHRFFPELLGSVDAPTVPN